MSVPHDDTGSISRSLAALGAAIFLIVAWALPGTASTVMADDGSPPASIAGGPVTDLALPDPADTTAPTTTEPEPELAPPEPSATTEPTTEPEPEPTPPEPSETTEPTADELTPPDPSATTEPTTDELEPEPTPPEPSETTEPTADELTPPDPSATTEPTTDELEPALLVTAHSATPEPLVDPTTPGDEPVADEEAATDPTVPTTTDPGHDGGHDPGHDGGQGNPTRILFEVRWHDLDGTQWTSPDAADLPPGSWDSFVLRGESETGSGRPTLATCSYPVSGGSLECSYVSPGHGDGTGLVVPARSTATYDVGVSGIPADWTVDGSTVGTFVGSVTCPRGDGGGGGGGGHSDGGHTDGGHTDGGHTDGGHTGGGGGGSGGGNTFVCTHVVDLVQQPTTTTTEPTTTTTEPTTTTTEPTTPTTTDTTVAQAPQTSTPSTTAALASGARTLPSTGTSSPGLVVVAFVVIVVGIGLVRVSGARRPH